VSQAPGTEEEEEAGGSKRRYLAMEMTMLKTMIGGRGEDGAKHGM